MLSWVDEDEQKVPFFGDLFVKEIPPSDNVSLLLYESMME